MNKICCENGVFFVNDLNKICCENGVFFVNDLNNICRENGVFFVNDLISENKMLFTYEEFINHYNIRLNFIEYFSILSAIPHRWKLLIRGIGKLNLIENDIVEKGP
jgi:hypothetical protein